MSDRQSGSNAEIGVLSGLATIQKQSSGSSHSWQPWENDYMTNGQSTRVESSLAGAVHDYLLAEQNERISEDENLRPVCQWLGVLLGELLKSEGRWSQYNWVDGISPCTAERASPSDLVFTGLLIWLGGSKSSEWKEPLFAAIHISEIAPAQLTYEIRFADADRGLGKCTYGTPHDFPKVPVNNWLFTFASSDSHK